MIVFSILFVIRTIAGMDHDSPYIDSSDNEISEPESTTESRLKLNVIRYINSPFAYTTNTCRNRTSNQYYLYAHPFHQSSPFVIQSELYKVVENENTVFRWGWSYSWKTESVPTSEPWIEDEGVFIAQPYVQRHICHFAESLGHVLMKLMDRSLYPPFYQLYLPTFRYTREYEWSKAYLQLVRELVSSGTSLFHSLLQSFCNHENGVFSFIGEETMKL